MTFKALRPGTIAISGGKKMALKTPEQYEDSLRKMNFKIGRAHV